MQDFGAYLLHEAEKLNDRLCGHRQPLFLQRSLDPELNERSNFDLVARRKRWDFPSLGPGTRKEKGPHLLIDVLEFRKADHNPQNPYGAYRVCKSQCHIDVKITASRSSVDLTPVTAFPPQTPPVHGTRYLPFVYESRLATVEAIQKGSILVGQFKLDEPFLVPVDKLRLTTKKGLLHGESCIPELQIEVSASFSTVQDCDGLIQKLVHSEPRCYWPGDSFKSKYHVDPGKPHSLEIAPLRQVVDASDSKDTQAHLYTGFSWVHNTSILEEAGRRLGKVNYMVKPLAKKQALQNTRLQIKWTDGSCEQEGAVCPICSAKFSRLEALEAHLNVGHETINFILSIKTEANNSVLAEIHVNSDVEMVHNGTNRISSLVNGATRAAADHPPQETGENIDMETVHSPSKLNKPPNRLAEAPPVRSVVIGLKKPRRSTIRRSSPSLYEKGTHDEACVDLEKARESVSILPKDSNPVKSASLVETKLFSASFDSLTHNISSQKSQRTAPLNIKLNSKRLHENTPNESTKRPRLDASGPPDDTPSRILPVTQRMRDNGRFVKTPSVSSRNSTPAKVQSAKNDPTLSHPASKAQPVPAVSKTARKSAAPSRLASPEKPSSHNNSRHSASDQAPGKALVLSIKPKLAPKPASGPPTSLDPTILLSKTTVPTNAAITTTKKLKVKTKTKITDDPKPQPYSNARLRLKTITAPTPPLPQLVRKRYPVPAAPPGVTFFKTTSKRILATGDITTESDDEVAETWLVQRHHEALAAHPGLSPDEAAFLCRYDDHFMKERLGGDRYVGAALRRFVRRERRWLAAGPEPGARAALFARKAAGLRALGVVDDGCVLDCLVMIRKAQGRADAGGEGESGAGGEGEERQAGEVGLLERCVCGDRVLDPTRGVSCAEAGCLRVAYHLACVGLNERAAGWVCETCRVPAARAVG